MLSISINWKSDLRIHGVKDMSERNPETTVNLYSFIDGIILGGKYSGNV